MSEGESLRNIRIGRGDVIGVSAFGVGGSCSSIRVEIDARIVRLRPYRVTRAAQILWSEIAPMLVVFQQHVVSDAKCFTLMTKR
jgi:hypothetical protein